LKSVYSEPFDLKPSKKVGMTLLESSLSSYLELSTHFTDLMKFWLGSAHYSSGQQTSKTKSCCFPSTSESNSARCLSM